jgi:hypothetical protein
MAAPEATRAQGSKVVKGVRCFPDIDGEIIGKANIGSCNRCKRKRHSDLTIYFF